MTRYDYRELREKALAPDATFLDKANLACWLENYEPYAWNGECYDLDGGITMRPVYEQDESGDYAIVDYEIF